MPDANGFLHLSDAPPRISIECRDCPRRGSYDRDRAIAERGDLALPDFLHDVSADCPRRRHAVNGAGCAARYAAEIVVALQRP